MTFLTDIQDLAARSEAVGATVERQRIRRVIESMSGLNTDELDYRRRVLAAIQPVTTVDERAELHAGATASPARAEGTLARSSTAAAAFNEAPPGASAT